MRILLTRLDALGDLVCSSAAISAVRTTWPDAHITLVTRHQTAELMKYSKDIDELLAINAKSDEVTKCAQKFHQIDLAIAMAPQLSDLHFVETTQAQQRIGFRYLDWKTGRLSTQSLTKAIIPDAYPARWEPLNTRPIAHEVEQVLGLVRAAGADTSNAEMSIALAPQIANTVALLPKKCILLPLSARWFVNEPQASFAAYVRMLKDLRRFGLPLVVTYDKECKDLAEVIQKLGVADAVLGGLPLTSWIALFTQAACVVSVDTSAVHIASALKKPIVSVFQDAWFEVQSQKWAPYKTPSALLRMPEKIDDVSMMQLRTKILHSVQSLLDGRSHGIWDGAVETQYQKAA